MTLNPILLVSKIKAISERIRYLEERVNQFENQSQQLTREIGRLKEKEKQFNELMSLNDIAFCEMSLAVAERIVLYDQRVYCHRLRPGNSNTKGNNLHNLCR